MQNIQLKNLIKKIKKYNSNSDEELIKKAYQFAKTAHKGEKRLSGEPVFHHCLDVASLLTNLKLDDQAIAAGLLHDVIEHTNTTKNDLDKKFGGTVAELVDGVSVIKRYKTSTGEQKQIDNLRKLLLASAKDVRVLLIRLAEKVHSLKTIEGLPQDLRKQTAEKALDVYAPLAERLGVYYFKWQLEDLAFKYLNHPEHTRVQEFFNQTREEREQYIEKVAKIVKDTLLLEGIESIVHGRPKHFYSIYKKMQTEKDIDETEEEYLKRLHDKQGFRILVDNENQCYQALDTIHQLWEHWGEFKDYIANPKPNGYRSLHTSVLCEEDKIAEFQIRTLEMHNYNEYGPAAHAYYKTLGREKGSTQKAPAEYSAWLKDLVKWQEKIDGEKDFEKALKINVYPNQVFVISPKGDVFDLPKGATPLDYAYRIHSDIGNRCIGAKVDGKLVSLDYELQNGEVVEIMTSKGDKKPSSDWLDIVKSSEAQEKIRKALKRFI